MTGPLEGERRKEKRNVCWKGRRTGEVMKADETFREEKREGEKRNDRIRWNRREGEDMKMIEEERKRGEKRRMN